MVAAVGGPFKARQSIPRNTSNRRHLKGGQPMRGFKTILSTTALLAGLAVAPAARAQVMVSIGVPPVCAYGYYDYAPYACSPYGFYGPGYFYNGIFLGMGPWAGWGYGHGWGGHRFVSEGGEVITVAAVPWLIAAIMPAVAVAVVVAEFTLQRLA